MTLQNFLGVDTIFFTVLNYPMSYLEFFGTIFTAWSVFLAAKNKVITWPVGLVGVILYGFLFYQIHLYSDLLEQLYYFVTTFWGWYLWSKPKTKLATDLESHELKVAKVSTSYYLPWTAGIILATIALGFLMSRIHLLLPTYFPVAASFAYLDSFTTILSFVATIFLAKRQIENWHLWIIVDVIGVWLYYQKGAAFLSLLYLAFLINALFGLSKWRKELAKYEQEV
jgi:nicotinamide mononucleotide transporter